MKSVLNVSQTPALPLSLGVVNGEKLYHKCDLGLPLEGARHDPEHALHRGLEAWREDEAGNVLPPQGTGWTKGVSAMPPRAVPESPPCPTEQQVRAVPCSERSAGEVSNAVTWRDGIVFPVPPLPGAGDRDTGKASPAPGHALSLR